MRSANRLEVAESRPKNPQKVGDSSLSLLSLMVSHLTLANHILVEAKVVDRISPERRSANMSQIRSKDTKPELRVRKAAHAQGFRFRLHRKNLPGKPDLVFPALGAVIFVHGCFWHRHQGCVDCSDPRTRREYWIPKFAATMARDRRAIAQLRALGWRVLTIWECETVNLEKLDRRLTSFLNAHRGRRKTRKE